MARVTIPPEVSLVVICADNDIAGQGAAKALARRCLAEQRRVKILTPESLALTGQTRWRWPMADLTREAIEQTPDVTPEDVRDEEALLQELAALSPLAYDRRRESAAKLLGVRVGTLDAEMAARRPRQTEPEGGGTPLLFSDPEPWPRL